VLQQQEAAQRLHHRVHPEAQETPRTPPRPREVRPGQGINLLLRNQRQHHRRTVRTRPAVRATVLPRAHQVRHSSRVTLVRKALAQKAQNRRVVEVVAVVQTAGHLSLRRHKRQLQRIPPRRKKPPRCCRAFRLKRKTISRPRTNQQVKLQVLAPWRVAAQQLNPPETARISNHLAQERVWEAPPEQGQQDQGNGPILRDEQAEEEEVTHRVYQ
jgi:hypothetical protein